MAQFGVEKAILSLPAQKTDSRSTLLTNTMPLIRHGTITAIRIHYEILQKANMS